MGWYGILTSLPYVWDGKEASDPISFAGWHGILAWDGIFVGPYRGTGYVGLPGADKIGGPYAYSPSLLRVQPQYL